MVGGGPMFVTVNGYAYQRFDWPQIIQDMEKRKKKNKEMKPVSEGAIEAAEYKAFHNHLKKLKAAAADNAAGDIEPFRNDLSDEDRAAFDAWRATQDDKELHSRITMPESHNPTYVAFNHSAQNDAQLKTWYEKTKPRLEATAEKWRKGRRGTGI